MDKLRVVLLGSIIDGTDVGEAYVGFKWAEALSCRTQLTVLSMQRSGRRNLAKQLPGAEVITWPEPPWLLRYERLNSMLKPSWPLLCFYARRWLATAIKDGRRFDILHQIGPNAPRYPSPFFDAGIPYIIGPVGGALATPPAFFSEANAAPWFTKLRNLDGLRFRYDPYLRRSFAGASAVLGVAPYVLDTLREIPLKRFVPMLELGVDDVASIRKKRTGKDFRLLHVGRAIRTKGLRDVVRAMALLKDLRGIRLTSAGDGEDLDNCRHEAEQLGVADYVDFLGHITRPAVEKLYQDCDVFVFPSFREPGGSVLYEAMRHGLPIIAAKRGGPEHVLDDTSGIRLRITTPDALSRDIADAVRRLFLDADFREKLGNAARDKIGREGLWRNKADRLVELYHEVLVAS